MVESDLKENYQELVDNLQDYKKILEDLKFKFKSAQIKSFLKLNSDFIVMLVKNLLKNISNDILKDFLIEI
ncbi:hypothetical protein [Lebetimonas sp. JH292]|uniref:hypothetical protein n=1 Tax=Lebetimonas sp. JH292 TaxID=990068 RepID=UPI00046544CC|nr:hypothetical protein [Lebetimonas sp. JH292]